MNRSTSAVACLAAAALLAGCEARERAAAERERAGRASQANASARASAALIAPSPESVGMARPDGEGTVEVRQPVLAPSAGAAALREQAGKVASAASGAGPRESAAAQALAGRLRLEALSIDVAEAERLAGRAVALALDASDAKLAAERLRAAGGTGTFGARSDAARKDAAGYAAARAAVKQASERAREALSSIDARITEESGAAEQLDGEILALRGEAATAPPSRAVPLMLEAQEKLGEAQARRLEASKAELEAEEHRSSVRVVDRALAGDDAADTYLAGRATDVAKASAAMQGAVDSAKAAAEELGSLAKSRAESLGRLRAEEFDPVAKAAEESLNAGNLPARDPIDIAQVALLRARLAAAQALVTGAESLAAEGTLSAEASARVDTLRDQARRALAEARDALAGVDAERGGTMLAATNGIAAALGIDLTAPAAPPADEAAAAPAEPGEAPPEGDAAPADAAEPAQPEPEAPPADQPPEEEPKS
jgi:hypothetical protein